MRGRPRQDGAPGLVERALAGDEVAWRELVDEYAELVWAVARSFRLDPADAADVAQTTWLTLAERLASVRDPSRLPGWLVATTRNAARRLLRDRHGEILAGAGADIATWHGQARSAEVEAMLGAERAGVWRALRSLPDRCQRLLTALAFAPEWSYRQISLALDVPLASIGPARGRCLRRLRERLGGATPADHRSRGEDVGGRGEL
ncbi:MULTISPECIES: RNA polymerase sigma factor [Actinoalloteichus]|uniref:RNA polymerase sigma factor, sigma-70 family n=1 Tax=Actinoalloteichus caeruleus DSM 43889 TaxID=1120930 RepID=A0ABT1JL85_ACTCY|nr:sigma-70 family RNA polymerase sigma factor [Actinoalloteichus caeruleus]MCP2333278.1 RNA polymerase sigma factor, sigma-70 family [Actinoalloteichus caeruleus DSM 43889]